MRFKTPSGSWSNASSVGQRRNHGPGSRRSSTNSVRTRMVVHVRNWVEAASVAMMSGAGVVRKRVTCVRRCTDCRTD